MIIEKRFENKETKANSRLFAEQVQLSHQKESKSKLPLATPIRPSVIASAGHDIMKRNPGAQQTGTQ